MSFENDPTVWRLVRAVLGDDATDRARAVLVVDPALDGGGVAVPRAVFAMALNIVLHDGLMRRVPSGAAVVAAAGTMTFDHGALRTIRFADGDTGGLPGGTAAFARILEPLGYAVAGTYPLPVLRMTGVAFAHADHPATIPQFFVSELHVDRFGAGFGEVAERVFGTSRDPLNESVRAILADFAAGTAVAFDHAAAALPDIAAAFDRQHGPVRLDDYEALLAESAEAAWIATEGNAFNHVTDRVADVAALAARLKAEGRPMKERIEVSASGRVRQTALKADSVERGFVADDGSEVRRRVPGSFYEMISRDLDPATGALDLSFDSGNATGIFAMTRVA